MGLNFCKNDDVIVLTFFLHVNLVKSTSGFGVEFH